MALLPIEPSALGLHLTRIPRPKHTTFPVGTHPTRIPRPNKNTNLPTGKGIGPLTQPKHQSCLSREREHKFRTLLPCTAVKLVLPGPRTRLAESEMSGEDLILQQDIVRLVDELQNVLPALKRDYKEEIDKLKQQVQELKESSEADRSTSVKCIEDSNSLKKENDKPRAKINRMEEELASREKHDADRSEDVERSRRELDQIWTENETPQDRLGDEVRKNGILNRELEMARNAIKDSEVNISGLQKELKQARAQNEEVQQALKGVFCWMALAVYGVQAGYGMLTARMAVFKSEKVTLTDRIATAAKENELLKWLLCQSDAKVANSIHQEALIEQLEKDAEAVKRESEENKQIIGRLQDRIAGLELVVRTALHSDQQVLPGVARQASGALQSQTVPDDGSSSVPKGLITPNVNPPRTSPPRMGPPGTSPPGTNPSSTGPPGTSSSGTSSPGRSSPGTSDPDTSISETTQPPVRGHTALYFVRRRADPRNV